MMRRFHLQALALAIVSTGCAAAPEVAEDTGETSSAISREIGDDDPTNPSAERCLGQATGSLNATATSLPLGGSATLSWSVSIPSRCSLRVYLDGDIVGTTGSRVVTPLATAERRLRVYLSGYGERTLQTREIAVVLPEHLRITSNDQVPTFAQAVGTPCRNAVAQTGCQKVEIADNVQLDLSNRQNIVVASNVLVYGGRRGREPGPRLFTTTRPKGLFKIGDKDAESLVSNVRFTGLRIEGPDMGVADPNDASAFHIESAINVQIDHNEISGWAGSAINVKDNKGTAGSPSPTDTVVPPHTVNIRDNFIHHNQAEGTAGYGVVVGYGAHPLIERNVFDANRHAIAGDGREGTGYTADYNLVLEGGGKNSWWAFPGTWSHTHQFDMHGRNDCGITGEFNCGPAGHTTLIRHNAFFYTEDIVIKLRGTPEVGMFVSDNVFSKSPLLAIVEEESGLVSERNEFLYNGKNQLGTCDFDGDGVNDSFMATGQSWWYRSGTTGPWEFLNPSTKKLSEVSLGFFDGDNRCDVKVDGIIHPGGRPPTPWRAPTGPVVPITPWVTGN